MQRDEYLVYDNLQLTRGTTLRIDDGRGMNVCAWTGCVWITEDGGGRDVILEAGEWHRIERRGLTLIHALKTSAVALTTPHGQACARRIDLARPGTQVPRTLYEPAPGWRGGAAVLKTQFRKNWAECLALLARRPGAAL